MDYPNERDCEHGQLKRSCNICEYEKDIAELKAQVESYRKLLHDDQVLFTELDDKVHPNIELDARAYTIREVLKMTPGQYLNDIKADAIELVLEIDININDNDGCYDCITEIQIQELADKVRGK